MLVRVIVAILLALLLSLDRAGAEPVIGHGPVAQRIVERIEKISFSKSFEIKDGPGGARDYVGVWPLGAPLDDDIAVRKARIAWKYLDGRSDAAAVAERRAAKSGPTGGRVLFEELSVGQYEIRLYRNGSVKGSDMAMRAPFEIGAAALELLHYGGATVTVQRSPVGEADRIEVRFSDGRVSEIHLDRAVSFKTRRVDLADGP